MVLESQKPGRREGGLGNRTFNFSILGLSFPLTRERESFEGETDRSILGVGVPVPIIIIVITTPPTGY